MKIIVPVALVVVVAALLLAILTPGRDGGESRRAERDLRETVTGMAQPSGEGVMQDSLQTGNEALSESGDPDGGAVQEEPGLSKADKKELRRARAEQKKLEKQEARRLKAEQKAQKKAARRQGAAQPAQEGAMTEASGTETESYSEQVIQAPTALQTSPSGQTSQPSREAGVQESVPATSETSAEVAAEGSEDSRAGISQGEQKLTMAEKKELRRARAEQKKLERQERRRLKAEQRELRKVGRRSAKEDKGGGDSPKEDRKKKEPEPPKEMYGIVYDAFEVETNTIKSGQTLSHLLGGMGIGSAAIDKVARTSKPVFDLTKINAGNDYTSFFSADTAGRRKLEYFVYHRSVTDFIVVSFVNDSVGVRKFEKEVETVRRKETAKIESSLWNSMVANGIPASLSVELENIYGWSVNFFYLQEGDEFTVIFDQRYVEGSSVGVGRIWGAVFSHGGKEVYAVPFRQDGKISYWDENGNSMKKQFLKAPLKYSRISSTFSRSRLHPVHKVYRPHLGVDYAAPVGTPVLSIADGVVSEKRWDSKGGGNILRIKHSNGYVSTYMHLSKYASGIKVGSRVEQGQKVAEVGNTGTSTGPHLDFRMQKNGEYINPLKLPSGTSEPINPANRTAFNGIRDRVIAELKGEVPDSLKLTTL